MAMSKASTPFDRAVEAHVDGNLAEAEALYRQAGEEGEPDGWFQLGSLLTDLGRDDDAFAAFQAAAAAGDLEARLNVANMLADHYDRPDEALAVYRESIEAGDARALTESGTVLARLERTEEATEQLRQAIDAGEPNAHLPLGRLLEEAGDIEAATAEFQRAVDAEVAGSWAELAAVTADAGDEDAAEEFLRAGVAHNDAWSYRALGLVLFDQGQLDEAEALFTDALERGHTEVWLPYADCLADWEDHEAQAEAAYRQAIALGDEDAHFNFAVFLLDEDRRDEALVELDHASAAGHADEVAEILAELGAEDE
jgi:tetratricopeptide (TPR) repeat protein